MPKARTYQGGEQVGNYTVLDYAPRQSPYRSAYNCRCGCGAVVNVLTHELASGGSKGCRECADKRRLGKPFYSGPRYPKLKAGDIVIIGKQKHYVQKNETGYILTPAQEQTNGND